MQLGAVAGTFRWVCGGTSGADVVCGVVRAVRPGDMVSFRASLRLFKIAPGDFVQRLEHDIRGAITVGRWEAVTNIPLSSERQPFSRDRRARDIAAQAL